jgi:hypothetical protein
MKNLFIISVIVLTTTITSFAQYGSEGSKDARSMSMGNTANAISKNVFSIGTNPANIINSDEKITLSTLLPIPSISLTAGTNFISINNFNYYFGGVDGKGRILSESDKQQLNSLFSNGGLIITNTSLNLFSIGIKLKPSIGTFGFSINDIVEGSVTIPQAISQIALYGNPQNSVYNFNDSKASAWWIRDYSLTYARELSEIHQNLFSSIGAGVTFKLVQGFAYAGSQQISSSFSTGSQNQLSFEANNSFLSAFSDNFHVKYSFSNDTGKTKMSLFPTPAGNGFGVDLGLNASIGQKWNFALAVTDIGSINWNKNTAVTYSSGQYTATDLFDKSQQDSLKNKFKGTSDSTGSFSTNLPTALRLGASYKFYFKETFPGTLLVAMDINQGFNNMPGNSTKTRVSIGAEWKPMDWVPFIRTGFSFGGLTGFHWGLGLGIEAGVLEFNLSTYDMQTLVSPSSGKYLSLAFNSLWKF